MNDPFIAVYENGVLRPLAPIELRDREVVSLQIVEPTAARTSPEEELVRAQKASLNQLFNELDKIPEGSPDDGWSATEHDQVLYGWKK